MDLYADLVFEIEGEAIPVHRAVLAARSRFFRKALRRQWRSKVHCWIVSCCPSSSLSCSRWQTASAAMQPALHC